MGNPNAVRVGPGKLYIAPIGSTEPDDLATAWDAAWTELGYTDEGSSVGGEQSFENVMVAEELEPITLLPTTRSLTVSFALAELTAANLAVAFNGGTVDTPSGGLVTFEPGDAGTVTPVMIGWESDDALERWIFRRCIQVGSLDIARKRAPDKAVIACEFRCTKPAGAQSFKVIQDESLTAVGS